MQVGYLSEEFFLVPRERREAARELIFLHEPPDLEKEILAGFATKDGKSASFDFYEATRKGFNDSNLGSFRAVKSLVNLDSSLSWCEESCNLVCKSSSCDESITLSERAS